MTIAFEAMQFAGHVHRDQQRKYTGEPYAGHLAEVAGIVATVAGADFDFGFSSNVEWRIDQIIATSWLHDCMEDQGVTVHQLAGLFGVTVMNGVLLLSDLEQGNRAERKAASRARLAAAPAWVQTIKCADLISNTSSIVKHDPKFAAVYVEEKRLLLDVMTQADPRLLAMAREQIGGAA